KSCNSSFANIGMLLDRERFADTLLSMLFNTDLPVSFSHRQSHISMRESMTNAEIMQSAIGQGETLITPLHLNMVTQAIANGGNMYIPYMVDRVENVDGVLVKQYVPTLYRSIITPREAEILTEMMIQVVENGTASKLSNQSYTAAGKTGSAEYSSVKGQSHAWFTGFAPAEDPEIVVTVILEGAGSGGDYAAPIARRIFSQYFN
ncbi:MAG: penicillin-binding transpeptidase domain-containing protein, partial [Lachnospiraceae bacterium]